MRYNGISGAFIDVFVEEGSGGLGEPTFMIFAPQVVPEPGTLAMLWVGLAGLALCRLRRFRAGPARPSTGGRTAVLFRLPRA